MLPPRSFLPLLLVLLAACSSSTPPPTDAAPFNDWNDFGETGHTDTGREDTGDCCQQFDTGFPADTGRHGGELQRNQWVSH